MDDCLAKCTESCKIKSDGCYTFENLSKLFDIFTRVLETFTNVSNTQPNLDNLKKIYNIIYEIITTEITFLHYFKHIAEITNDLIGQFPKQNAEPFYGLHFLKSYTTLLLQNVNSITDNNINNIDSLAPVENDSIEKYQEFINKVTSLCIVPYFNYKYFDTINQLFILFKIYSAESEYERSNQYKCDNIKIIPTIACSIDKIYAEKKFEPCGKYKISDTSNPLMKISSPFGNLYMTIIQRLPRIELLLKDLLKNHKYPQNNKQSPG